MGWGVGAKVTPYNSAMTKAIETALYEAQAVRQIDAAAIAGGISGSALMQRAAEAAWQSLRERWPEARRIGVLCGPGHNGGDGYALAAIARDAGCQVRLYQWGAVPDTDTARPFIRAWRSAGGEVAPLQAALEASADVWVDGLLGIGLDRPVDDEVQGVINSFNARRHAVLALDVPSGLNASTGQVMGAAFEAQLTVSFIAHKVGLWTGAGPHVAGRRVLADLSVPHAAGQGVAPAATLIPAITAADLPRRRADAHKGQQGHVLVMGGNDGAMGAALMCARAALRSGAGYVSVATRSAHAGVMVAAQPELMVSAAESPAVLATLIRRASVLAVGPGLGQDEWARWVLDAALAAGLPAVLDADALNGLAQRPQRLGGTVMTPHPREAARLLRCVLGAVEADRPAAVRQLQQWFGGAVVLKGAGTLVASGAATLRCCPAGNPGMAVAGMGDVLTGVIAALMAQGIAPDAAAALGVRAHADAGDRVAARIGQRGMIPSDLIDALRGVLNP